MERTDELLSALSAGDNAGKRQPDSPDDFEHLMASGESPQRAASALIDAERRARASDSESEPDSQRHLLDETLPPLGPALLPASAPPPPRPDFSTPEPELFEPASRTPEPTHELPPQPELPKPELYKPEPQREPEPPKPAPPAPKVEPEVPIVAPPKPAPEPPKAAPPKPAPEPPKTAPPKPAPEPPKAAPPKPTPAAHVIEAEVIFCQMGLDAWFDPQRLHPEVESLLYWRCPARSGAALGAGLVLLVALAICSAVSVVSHVALLLLAGAVGFRVYKSVLQAVQKTNDGHPFKALLETDISVPAERAQELAAAATAHLNAASNELRRLFLVEDLVDSLKFGVLLWCLTYVGACFNGITLLILGWIALFTLPKAYEMNKAQVDSNLELARAKINEITAKVRAAVPLGKKTESEKEK